MLAVLGWDMETPLVGLSIAARAPTVLRRAIEEAHIPRAPSAEPQGAHGLQNRGQHISL